MTPERKAKLDSLITYAFNQTYKAYVIENAITLMGYRMTSASTLYDESVAYITQKVQEEEPKMTKHSTVDGYPLIDISDALTTLRDLIDGSTECRGRDTGISEVIRLLEHVEAEELGSMEEEV